jgi:hypothetical protein
MSALLLLPRWLGIGKIDVIPAVGALITGKSENAFSIGYIVHFASGIAFAYIYWAILLLMKLPAVWWTFGLAGCIHGIIVMLLVCIAVMEHHPIARYHERGPMTGPCPALGPHCLRRGRWIGRPCFAMSLARNFEEISSLV